MKKLLVLMLLLVTVVILAVPTPALAWGGWGNKTAFVAVAEVAVVNPGVVTPRKIGNSYIIQTTTGEQVAGNIVSCNHWPDIVGLQILFEHQSTTFLNLRTMKITGTARGSITVMTAAGQPMMAGSYSAFIRGTFSLDENGDPVIYDRIFDAARFSLTGVNGTDFAGITASGIGVASLKWTYLPDYGLSTLAGPMILTGTYQ
jgi:hypothetical protein